MSDASTPEPPHQLCALAELPVNTARGFELTAANGDRLGVIVWHTPDGLSGFVNQCPHLGLPLETFPDRFLSADGAHLICSAHGAQFDMSGACIAGPCRGQALRRVALVVRDGMIFAQW